MIGHPDYLSGLVPARLVQAMDLHVYAHTELHGPPYVGYTASSAVRAGSAAYKCHLGLFARHFIVQELCESRGGRPELSALTSLLVSVDVRNY